MSADIVQSLIAGFTAGGISIAAIPLLFSGKLRFDRELAEHKESAKKELSAIEAGFSARLTVLSELNERQERTIGRLEDELREQYRINADQSREVMRAIGWLRDLQGLAAQDRRVSSRKET